MQGKPQSARSTQNARPRQAIVMLTHRNSRRIYRHFERLRDDLRDVMPAFLCLHRPTDDLPAPPFVPDFTVTVSDGISVLPLRHEKMLGAGGSYHHYIELAYIPAFCSEMLSEFDFIWMIEGDVDFSGNWSAFFERATCCTVDLIGVHFTKRKDSTNWVHWRRFSAPPVISSESVAKGFFPMVRLSRRFLAAYVSEMANPEWTAHLEAAYPTIAFHHGFSMAAVAQTPAAAAPSLADFTTPPVPDVTDRESFHCDFNLSNSYFHETPENFPRRNRLYHPVKVEDDVPLSTTSPMQFAPQEEQQRSLPLARGTLDALAALALGLRSSIGEIERDPLSDAERKRCRNLIQSELNSSNP